MKQENDTNWKGKFKHYDKLWKSRHHQLFKPYDYFRQLVATGKLKPRIKKK